MDRVLLHISLGQVFVLPLHEVFLPAGEAKVEQKQPFISGSPHQGFWKAQSDINHGQEVGFPCLNFEYLLYLYRETGTGEAFQGRTKASTAILSGRNSRRCSVTPDSGPLQGPFPLFQRSILAYKLFLTYSHARLFSKLPQ